jgi:hypothetical protein
MDEWLRARREVAGYLNLNLNDPPSWPVELLDKLIRKREFFGEDEFLREIARMMTPPRT